MIYHVLPGDAQVEEFKKAGIEGEIIVFREALVSGPIDARGMDEFWEQRARFILSEYGEDEIEYQDKVASVLSDLSEMTSEDEVHLWFEYELFCSVNMWFCLAQLGPTGAAIFRVDPSILTEADRWSGFGSMNADELSRCYETRRALLDRDIKLGTDLWNAYRFRNSEELAALSEFQSEAFPYLSEVAAAAIDVETRPAEILAEIQAEGKKDFEEIFPEFQKRAGVYGLGDLQVRSLIAKLNA